MWKYSFAVLSSFAIITLANAACCENKERTTSYLDIAVDLISKAKLKIPECKKEIEIEDKECPEIKASDCADWYERGYNKSGVYTIWPISRVTVNKSLQVYCDMETDEGGWTVIQRRGNFGSPNDLFDKDWESYKSGFGDIQKDFWLGNDNIFALSNQKLSTIRFDLQDKNLDRGYAKYSVFWIDDELQKYKLHISNYSGNVGDGMDNHNNMGFTTKDQTNDLSTNTKNCAMQNSGGWWYNKCYRVNLNGLYNATTDGVEWRVWKGGNKALPWAEMKIRPENFSLK